MASIFQVFDLNEALAAGTQSWRHPAGGFEAPRNSLDVGSNFEATDVSTGASSSRPEDVPFGYECYNPGLAASGRRDGLLRCVESGAKRRGPSVVARLMGLDALPDELPAVRPRKSLQGKPTGGGAKAEGGNPVLIRQRSQGAASQRPPLPRVAMRCDEEERPAAPVLPFRDHPQEEQLQRFKKEFEAKQQERLVASQLQEMNLQLEEKKNKVRATLDKARIALSQGIIADPKRLNGQGRFEESKEFLDAMEFLQCNKDFIFQFLQQKPHVVFSNEDSSATTPVAHGKPLKKGKGGGASPRDLPERKREGFSPRAFARLFMFSESRKRSNDHTKQQQAATTSESQPVIERSHSAGSRRTSADSSDDVKLRTSVSTNSRYMLPLTTSKPSSDEARGTNRNGAQDVIREIKERLRRRDENPRPEGRSSKDSVIRKEHLSRDSKEIAREIAKQAREAGSRKSSLSTLTRSLSTGKRVSMMRPDMDDMTCTSDGEDMSTPSVKILRENVTRACISLPSSPHLLPRSHEAAAAPKVTQKRVTENTRPALVDPTDSPATFQAVATKKTGPTLESSRCGSQRPSTESEKRVRRSASVNESCALKQKITSPVTASKKLPDSANKPVSNLTRSRSVPNMALLRERGQCTTDTARAAKSLPEAAAKPARTPIGDKRKLSFFSVGRRKSKDGHVQQATTPPDQRANSSPVLSRVAALAEACVSQSHTLSDADSAANVRLNVRSSRSAFKKRMEQPKPVACADIDRRAPPSADDSVGPKSSVDSHGVPPGADEFLEARPRLTSAAPNESLRTAPSAPPSTVRSPSPRTHQVQSGKKSQKRARNVQDDDKETRNDQSEKPSPVSELKPPFEEKSSSPAEFKEITNDLSELRIRLRHLKVGGNARTRDEVENVPEMVTRSDAHRSPSYAKAPEKPHLPAGTAAEFAFVRDILVTSGFHTHGGRSIARWHSRTQPISHHVLMKVESVHLGAARRRVLFDAVNEILVAHLDCEQPWLRITATKAHVAKGRRFVEDVWSAIHNHPLPARNDFVESLVAHDLHTSSLWPPLHREVDRICLHLEHLLWNDLVEELCRSL